MNRDGASRVELLQGTLELLNLRTLVAGAGQVLSPYAPRAQTARDRRSKWEKLSRAVALILNPADRETE